MILNSSSCSNQRSVFDMELLRSEVSVWYGGVKVRGRCSLLRGYSQRSVFDIKLFMPKVKVWYSLEVHVRGQYMILRSSSCSSHKSVLVFMESLISVWYEGVQVRGPFVHFNIKQQWFDILEVTRILLTWSGFESRFYDFLVRWHQTKDGLTAIFLFDSG